MEGFGQQRDIPAHDAVHNDIPADEGAEDKGEGEEVCRGDNLPTVTYPSPAAPELRSNIRGKTSPIALLFTIIVVAGGTSWP